MSRGDLLQASRRALMSPHRGAVLVASIVLLGFVTGCGGSAQSQGAPGCSDAILDDWTDGHIDRVYDAECYLAAIDALPEDVRAYSSAEDDISRALQSLRASDAQADGSEAVSRTLSEAGSEAAAADTSGVREVPIAVLALIGAGLVVVAGGIAATLARWLRQRH